MAGKYKKVDFFSWQEEKKETKVVAVKRPRKKLTSPLFAQYVENIEDEYWQEIFIKASTGRFPKGFSFYEGNLVYKKGVKVINISMEENIYDLISFFRKHGNLISPSEIEEVERVKNIQEKKDGIENWSDICKQRKKQLLIDYAYLLTKNYKLNKGENKRLISLLLTGLNFKYFDKKDIEIKDISINNIRNLKYINGEFCFIT
jgi:hypothetical protein